MDWSNVPINTPITMWDTYGTKHKGYFAGYQDGLIRAWCFGRKSTNALHPNDFYTWDCGEIREELC